MQFTQRQRFLRRSWRPLGAALLVGLLLGFAGPFGSYPAFPTATRYAYWIGLTLSGAVAVMAADAMLPAGQPRAVAARLAAVALASALPMTFVVAWTTSLLQPGRVYQPHQLPALFAAVAAIQLLIAFVVRSSRPTGDGAEPGPAKPADAAAPEPPPPTGFPPAILGRLPAAIGDDVLALETEDHYLRVHTARGSALILMRMADAVAVLAPELGLQVHRRWWVAHSAVTGLRAEGQKLSLQLVDQSLVPVGRTFLAAARARFADRNQPPRGPIS